MAYQEHPRIVTMKCDSCKGEETGRAGSFNEWRETHVHDETHRGNSKRDLCPGCVDKVKRIFQDVGSGGRDETRVEPPVEEVTGGTLM